MDLKSLNYFVAAYEEGNITAAAKRCHISQPSISSAISGLEDSLDIMAFSRHKKGVTPTAAGERLYLASRRLLSDAAALKAMFKPEKKVQKLTLGLMTALDVNRMVALLKPIIEEFEDLELHLSKESDGCDARVVCHQFKRTNEEFVPLWKERFVLALPEGHPLSLKEELFITDLENVPLVGRDYCGNELLDGAKAIGLKLNIVATAFSEEWAVALVSAGLGVAILPEGYISSEQKIVSRRFSNMDITRQVGIAYESKKQIPEALKMILNSEVLRATQHPTLPKSPV